jgi:Reverse transcriptase (RNA-dependent DNA polymerase)
VALNGVDIMSCDLENAYLNAPCKEKIWFEGGTKCGEDKGRVLVVVRALYGLWSAGASWRTALAEVLADLEFKPTRANPDVWIQAAVKPDGFRYYEMVFVYVDDVLAASHNAKEVLEAIGTYYKLKEGSLTKPEIYLGVNVSEFQLPDGRVVWSTSPHDSVKNVIYWRKMEEVMC